MADLSALTNTTLGTYLQPTSMQDYINSIIGPARQAIETQSGNRAQQIAENTFGRGIGLSTIAAYLQGQEQLARDTALGQTQAQATQQAQQAQLAALGQAAGITQQEANRAQQASQFKQQLGQQKSLANQQLLAGGLAAGAGAASNVAGLAFGPEIRSGLRSTLGLSTPGTPGSPGATASAATAPTEALPGPLQTPGLPSASAMDESGGGGLSTLANFSSPQLSMPSTPDFSSYVDPGLFGGGFGTYDFSGLNDLAGINAYQNFDWGNYF